MEQSQTDNNLELLPPPAEIPAQESPNDIQVTLGDFQPDEIVKGEDGGTYVLLAGLRRLARPYIQTEKHTMNTIIIPKEQTEKIDGQHVLVKTLHLPLSIAVYEVTLKDSRTFSDAADAFYLNCKDLGHFSSAVAASRAEARTLRKVLGVKEYAAEEMSPESNVKEMVDDGEIEGVQLRLLERKLGELQLSVKDALALVTAREIFTLKELTSKEAIELIRILNDCAKKKNKESKKDKEKDKE